MKNNVRTYAGIHVGPHVITHVYSRKTHAGVPELFRDSILNEKKSVWPLGSIMLSFFFGYRGPTCQKESAVGPSDFAKLEEDLGISPGRLESLFVALQSLATMRMQWSLLVLHPSIALNFQATAFAVQLRLPTKIQ